MSRQKNIFYKVAKDENSTTEIFCNLLGNKFFRDKFLEKFLDQKFISNIRYEEDINTQYCSTHGRPDLIIENETVKIIVEVKIDKYRGLTPKQPDGYLKELEESAQNNKWLIFLIPKGYVHFGEDDLEKIRSKYSHTDIKIEIVYWEDIISIIKENDLDCVNSFLHEFLKLLEERYIPKKIHFTSSEVTAMFTDNIPKALMNLYQIVDNIEYNKLATSDYKDNYESRHQHNITSKEYEYGIYFKDPDGKNILYFGIWVDFWIKHKKPLCICVGNTDPEKAKKEFIKRYQGKGKLEEHEKCQVSWFDKDILEREDCVDVIWEEIKSFLDAVKD